MTQQEATQAFFSNAPVIFYDRTISQNPIRMKYIHEIVWRKRDDGGYQFMVGAMDYNENSILRGVPELFQLDTNTGQSVRGCAECTSEA